MTRGRYRKTRKWVQYYGDLFEDISNENLLRFYEHYIRQGHYNLIPKGVLRRLHKMGLIEYRLSKIKFTREAKRILKNDSLNDSLDLDDFPIRDLEADLE